MAKLIFIVLIFTAFVFINPTKALAVDCSIQAVRDDPANKIECAFGKIDAPKPIADFLDKNPTGSGAISDFLSRLVALIYVIAAIVLIFMLLWGALEWMVSGGDKEKIAGAQRRILNAIIGIILFALAFAIISVLGAFTGFKFFKGQGITGSNEPGVKFICPDGFKVPERGPLGGGSNDPETACKGHGT